MARIRSIHPAAPLDEDVATMSLAARYAWAYLPCHADREGRLKDSAFTLKAAIFPGDVVDMEAILAELAGREHIIRYQVGGKRYIQIRTFKKYQAPHTRENASTIPPMSGQPGAEHDLGSARPGAEPAGVSPSPSDLDLDLDPSPISSESKGGPRAPTRSNGDAEDSGGDGSEPLPPGPCELSAGKITGYMLTKLFGAIRSREVGGLEWQGVRVQGGKDSSMADLLNEEPSLRADVAPTMALLYKRAKEGRAGPRSQEIITEPSLAFAAWCTSWTSLREELHGQSPKAKAAQTDDRCAFHRTGGRGKVSRYPRDTCPECRHARAATGTRGGEPSSMADLTAATDRKLAELRKAAENPATAEQLAGLRAERHPAKAVAG